MAITLIILLLIAGSVIFHFTSVWWFTPLASHWSAIDTTINITIWITGVVFIAVNLFLAYAIYRYRYKAGARADYQPENKKLEGWLLLVTSIGIAAMLAPGLYVWGQFVSPPADATVVEAVGQQWHWRFRLPGADGQLGKADVRASSELNPLGLDPNDPAGMDDLIIDSHELVLELNKPVKVLLRSNDVLHNFAVPQFRVKMDLVPGTVSYVWFIPTVVGQFDILCEELCGIGHFAMRGRVLVKESDDYQQWLAQQQSYRQYQARLAGDPEFGKAHYQVCASCHGAQGEGNQALHAPALAGQSGWYLKRQLRAYQQGLRGNAEGDVFGAQMIAMAQLVRDEQAINHLLAYIGSFNPNLVQAEPGNLHNGQRLYRNCSYCHGRNGEGIFAMNAPMLHSLEPWYLTRQLDYFKRQIRGNHPQDFYGAQMSLMAQSLHSEQDIADVVAYINSLQPKAGLTQGDSNDSER
ncbi:cytochrome C oxidase [Arsukibacterium ikkense]|uniref:cytochrome-c oxidase n=1 Tax=Arsukibacterium ikkense TaxID=336831 RepID=A0A0M2V900_9GAMM|nr:c-type cytochrome [Arsukibacterium ikkense]KKO47322.1 cytochrome C oxidase [Arsukibacterium ikkense]